jgi:hypothetical protein
MGERIKMVVENDDDVPAFPVVNKLVDAAGAASEFVGHPGMSLRDWFAGMAMQGLAANGQFQVHPGDDRAFGSMPEWCYLIADEMLKARGA